MSTRPRSYAQGTTVPVTNSQAEIMSMLMKFGVKQRAFYDDDEGESSVGFSHGGLSYRISVSLPKPDNEAFRVSEAGRRRTDDAAKNAYEGEVRRRWRSLVLAIKAKLVAVEDEITTFEEEFLAHVVTDNGMTVGQRMIPQIKQAAVEGRFPAALPMPGGR